MARNCPIFLNCFLRKIKAFISGQPSRKVACGTFFDTLLARKKSEGKRLGRPKGRLSTVTKLTGKDDLIREYLEKKIPQTVIARLLNVNRLTVRNYILTRKLDRLYWQFRGTFRPFVGF